MINNSATITLGQENITIKIKEIANQTDIISCLKEKIPELRRLYKEERTPIIVTGKVLKNKEMDEIRQIIQSEIDVKIEFDSPKVLGLYGIKKAFTQEIEISETMFHKGSLRSGQKIEFDGSIVIMGDVNAGSEVIASDNIAVVGTLRGTAHAGAKGNKKAIISANNIESTQLRIANIIKEIESQDDTRKTYACVEEDKIVLE